MITLQHIDDTAGRSYNTLSLLQAQPNTAGCALISK